MIGQCDRFWGSHGCVLPAGHDGPHECEAEGGPCSEFLDGSARYWLVDDGEWGQWMDQPHGFRLAH